MVLSVEERVLLVYSDFQTALYNVALKAKQTPLPCYTLGLLMMGYKWAQNR
jgi:hypothetical protein